MSPGRPWPARAGGGGFSGPRHSRQPRPGSRTGPSPARTVCTQNTKYFWRCEQIFSAPVVDVCGRVCEAGAVVVEGVDGGVVLGVEGGAAGLGGVVPPQEGETVHIQLPGPGLVPGITFCFCTRI